MLWPPGWVPLRTRVVIAVGGFPQDTPQEHIKRVLRETTLANDVDGWSGERVVGIFALEFSSYGRVQFLQLGFSVAVLESIRAPSFVSP